MFSKATRPYHPCSKISEFQSDKTGASPVRGAFYNLRENTMKSQMSLYEFSRLLSFASNFYPEDFYRFFYTIITTKRHKYVPKLEKFCASCGKKICKENKTGFCLHCFNKHRLGVTKEKNNSITKLLCTKCGSQITSSSKTGFCQSCVSKEKRQKLPSKDIILKDLENLSQVEIGKKYGVHQVSLYKYFKRNNINMDEVNQLKRTARKNKLISNYPSKDDLLQDLKTTLPKDIAKKYHAPSFIVYRWFKHYGIHIKELRGRKKLDSNQILDITKEKVIPSKDDLIRDLETMKRAEIAKKYKFSYYNMCRLFHQYNIMEK